MEKDLEFWLSFHAIPGFKANHFVLLKSGFDNLGKAWRASKDDLAKLGIPKSIINHIVSKRSKQNPEEQLEKLERYGANAITSDNLFFQENLQKLFPVSPIIYYKGELSLLEKESISLIGGHQTTDYSRQVAQNIMKDLIAYGYIFIGGLAKGMDSLCHNTAHIQKGVTIGVLSSGIDIIYPPENLDLSREITDTGVLITDKPLGTRPSKNGYLSSGNLITRISVASIFIDGKTDGIESSIISNAIKEKIPVFGIPGNIFSETSRGPNLFIVKGDATPILHFSEVAEYLGKS